MTPQVSVSGLKDDHRRQRNLEMKKTPLSLQSAHPRNFKAVRNSRAVKFAPPRESDPRADRGLSCSPRLERFMTEPLRIVDGCAISPGRPVHNVALD
jgi:hypothetical protein